MEIKYSKLI